MARDRVLIVGAGPVGLVAATYLASEGIPVTVFELSRELPEDLRASTFHPPRSTCSTVLAWPMPASRKG